MKVNDLAILRANPVLGSLNEMVRILAIHGDTATVKQLSRVNGIPGVFQVQLKELIVGRMNL